MEEFILFLLLISILIVVLNIKNTLNNKVAYLNDRIDQLTSLLIKIKDTQQRDRTATGEVVETPIKKPAIQTERLPDKKEAVDLPSAKPSPISESPKAEPEVKQEPAVLKFPTTITPPAAPTGQKGQITEPAKPGFFERNPDLEKFIGENLANKIGIGILVLGIGFFVKYAIDQDWINEYGRVFIGIFCGGVLIGIAHKLRKSFVAFSSVLVGGGIAILYVTIAIAFRDYGIIRQEFAFIIMVLITGFTILLSLIYNRIEIAIVAILGGFASPFMVSQGDGNYVVLFTYILVLDLGMLVLAYFKKWHLVNLVAYVFTVLLFGTWLGFRFNSETPGMIAGGMIFATLFYFTFFAMNIINNLKQRSSFKAPEFGLLLSNTFFYYAAGMVILNNPDGETFKGLFTALLGVFNFGFAFSLYRNHTVDRNLVFLLIGLVLTFISLAAPVQLEGNYITLFWAAEAALLLWLSQKSGIVLMKIAAGVVMALMVISLAMDWYNIYYYNSLVIENYSLNILLNKGYITSTVCIMAIAIILWLLNSEKETYNQIVNPIKVSITFLGVSILYLSQLLELTHHINIYVSDFSARSIIIGSYNMLFILLLILAVRKLYLPEKVKSGFALSGVFAIFSYLFVYHQHVLTARYNYISGSASSLGFMFHYLLIILLVVIAGWSLNQFRSWKNFNERSHNLYSWFFVFFFVFIASSELDHTVLLTAGIGVENMSYVLKQNQKIGYPILWGIASFILITVGLKKRRKHLRIISLTLLLITLLKLFIVDIKGISEGGKIAAFISLGALLLIVSFMYQRLKKILLSDETIAQPNEKEL